MYRTEDAWVNCFTLTAPETNIAIPSVAYLGLSAETGELSDNHDIITLKTQNLYNVGGNTANRGPAGEPSNNRGSVKPPQNKGGWGWFLFKTILFFAAIGGGYVGWTVFRTKQQYSRF